MERQEIWRLDGKNPLCTCEHVCACVHKLTSSLVGKNRTREETCLKTMAGFAWSLSLAPEGLVVSLQMSFGPL